MLAYDCETLRIVAVSDASIANYGYAREEFLAMTLLDIAPEEDHAAMLEYARANLGKRLGAPARAAARGTVAKTGRSSTSRSPATTSSSADADAGSASART